MYRLLLVVPILMGVACGSSNGTPDAAPVRIDRYEHEVRHWCKDSKPGSRLIEGHWCDAAEGQATDFIELWLVNDTAEDFQGQVRGEYYDQEGYRIGGFELDDVVEGNERIWIDPGFGGGMVVLPARSKQREKVITLMWADFEAQIRATIDQRVAEHAEAVSWGLRLSEAE